MSTTMTDYFRDVELEIRYAKLVAWDGCHKIYLAMDDTEAQWFLENYEETLEATPESMLSAVKKWFEQSCSLRFVQAVRHDADDPNRGFSTLVPQGATISEDEDDYLDD